MVERGLMLESLDLQLDSDMIDDVDTRAFLYINDLVSFVRFGII